MICSFSLNKGRFVFYVKQQPNLVWDIRNSTHQEVLTNEGIETERGSR